MNQPAVFLHETSEKITTFNIFKTKNLVYSSPVYHSKVIFFYMVVKDLLGTWFKFIFMQCINFGTGSKITWECN